MHFKPKRPFCNEFAGCGNINGKRSEKILPATSVPLSLIDDVARKLTYKYPQFNEIPEIFPEPTKSANVVDMSVLLKILKAIQAEVTQERMKSKRILNDEKN
jgi:hypothetical protein